MRRFLLISAAVHLSLLLAVVAGRTLIAGLSPPPRPPDRMVQVQVVRAPGADQPGAPATRTKPKAQAPSPPVPASPDASEPTPADKTQVTPTPPPVRLGANDPGLTDDVFGPHLVPPGPDPSQRNLPPRYPAEAARRGEQGTVALLVDVGPSGIADSVSIQHSSGSPSLDEAARAAVLAWHFTPAMRDGRPVGAEIPYVFNFCITCDGGLTPPPLR